MLYALVDHDTLVKRSVSLPTLLARINELSIPILQYRNKEGTLSQQRDALTTIRRHYDGTVIVNDTIELIDEADGLHLGQEDLQRFAAQKSEAVALVRERIGRKVLGLSTHSLEEIEEANDLDLDYIGLGAYRPTGTKREAKAKGEALLEWAKHSRHPVALIGGVRLDDRFGEEITYQVVGSGLY
jgi:thiamine-phosphate pyrophosphorylase